MKESWGLGWESWKETAAPVPASHHLCARVSEGGLRQLWDIHECYMEKGLPGSRKSREG